MTYFSYSPLGLFWFSPSFSPGTCHTLLWSELFVSSGALRHACKDLHLAMLLFCHVLSAFWVLSFSQISNLFLIFCLSTTNDLLLTSRCVCIQTVSLCIDLSALTLFHSLTLSLFSPSHRFVCCTAPRRRLSRCFTQHGLLGRLEHLICGLLWVQRCLSWVWMACPAVFLLWGLRAGEMKHVNGSPGAFPSLFMEPWPCARTTALLVGLTLSQTARQMATGHRRFAEEWSKEELLLMIWTK